MVKVGTKDQSTGYSIKPYLPFSDLEKPSQLYTKP